MSFVAFATMRLSMNVIFRCLDYVELESAIPYDVVRGLMAKGHKIRMGRGGYGGYQAILWDEVYGVYYGASE